MSLPFLHCLHRLGLAFMRQPEQVTTSLPLGRPRSTVQIMLSVSYYCFPYTYSAVPLSWVGERVWDLIQDQLGGLLFLPLPAWLKPLDSAGHRYGMDQLCPWPRLHRPVSLSSGDEASC